VKIIRQTLSKYGPDAVFGITPVERQPHPNGSAKRNIYFQGLKSSSGSSQITNSKISSI
jgi:hypothetical protein